VDYLPIFLKVRGRACAVVGGGEVAARKAASLLAAGGEVTVTAPKICPALAARVRAGELTHRAEPYRAATLDGAALVIAATDDRAVNAVVSRDAQARGVLVNVVDDPEFCSFIMPAVVDRSPMIVAVSTGGASPVLARMLRARLESLLPAGYGSLVRLAERFREKVKQALPPQLRRPFWERTLQGPVAELVLAGREAEADAAVEAALANTDAAELARGEVYLVGAGPGNPDLLTFAALRLLQLADIVVHDATIPAAIVDLARRDAQRTAVDRTTAARETAGQLISLAGQGKRVLRLTSGDGSDDGKLGADAAAAGIRFTFVPGVGGA
jgi:uroporphyrin-III C-methyltransferase / precorrin-2 dehydrogenase / sirohydrochlorin ferrochelatase